MNDELTFLSTESRASWSSQDFVDTVPNGTSQPPQTPRDLRPQGACDGVTYCRTKRCSRKCQRWLDLCSCRSVLDAFFLQAAKERLCNGVVPAVASSAHAGLKSVGSAEAPPIVAAVLTALVGVNNSSMWSTSPDRHHDRIQDQLSVDSRSGRPPNDLPGEQVHHDGKVEPSLPCAEWSERPDVVELSSGLPSPNRTCTLQRIRLSI